MWILEKKQYFSGLTDNMTNIIEIYLFEKMSKAFPEHKKFAAKLKT